MTHQGNGAGVRETPRRAKKEDLRVRRNSPRIVSAGHLSCVTKGRASLEMPGRGASAAELSGERYSMDWVEGRNSSYMLTNQMGGVLKIAVTKKEKSVKAKRKKPRVGKNIQNWNASLG